MSGQPCKGFLGFLAMKRAPRRPLSDDPSGRCGYFSRGLPHAFQSVPGDRQSSRHGVKSRTYPQKLMSGRAYSLRWNPGVSLRYFARDKGVAAAGMRSWRLLSGPPLSGGPDNGNKARRPRHHHLNASPNMSAAERHSRKRACG